MQPLHWNVDPLLRLGAISIRWYSAFFALGLLLSMLRLPAALGERNLPRENARTLAWLLPIGMFLGAHLVHLVFYEPRALVEQPLRLFQIGRGLASHGAALGTIVTTLAFARSKRSSGLAYLDAVIVASVWTFPWVRIGNFFNSEVLGLPTEAPWGVIFERVDPVNVRHPVQLYEALAGFALIAVSERLSRQKRRSVRAGTTFYLLLAIYFSYRFALEFLKAPLGVDRGWSLNMGHYLSIGPMLFCIAQFARLRRHEARDD